MHHLPPLPAAAEAYRAALPPGRFVAFPLHGLDRTGVRAWKVALFLDDAEEFPGNLPFGYGYGFDDDTALIGAFAEIAEAILPTLRLMKQERWTGSHADLLRQRGADGIVDPLTLCDPPPLEWSALKYGFWSLKEDGHGKTTQARRDRREAAAG